VSEFDYELAEGFVVWWGLSVSGYDDEIDGDLESYDTLVEVETAIQDLEDDYADDSGASLVRVRGAHGWREHTWNNGAVHRYQWRHAVIDKRCEQCQSPKNDLYMVKNEVWDQAGYGGWACFRCVETAIGRRLEPDDFKPDLPANTDYVRHEPDLRARIGIA